MKLFRGALLTTILPLLMMPIIAVCSTFYSYDGYKVYEITTTVSDDVDFLESLVDDDSFDFWSLSKPVGKISTVMVKPERQYWFEKSLNQRKIVHNISISDLENVLAVERQLQQDMENYMNDDYGLGRMTFDRYYKHDEINKYLDNLAEANENVKVRTIGKSYEGREIKTITITNGDGRVKNSIFIDGGIHAREWISPATALYIIDQLISGDGKKFLDYVDVIVEPVVNPDGYQYTHTKERLWRKTRSPSKDGTCLGTDGNRNFDDHWGQVGASSSPCSDTFRGNSPFSEKETQALRDAVDEIKENCKFYLTLHSYGNYLLYPYGWTSDLPETWKDLDDIANIGANAIKEATGTRYTVGSSTNVLYAAAGGSDDYMFTKFNIPITIVMELPGGGSAGFDLPAKHIEKTAKESAIGIFAMIQGVIDKYQ